MNKIVMLMAFLAITILASAQQSNLSFKLEKEWELSGLNNPESAVLDTKNQVLYVSNVNGAPTDKNGKGFISKVNLDGKILELKWIEGLDAPKGLTIYKGKLYATDIDCIVEINLTTKKLQRFKAKGATFLNDITVDRHGNVYASNTFGFSGIYKLPNKNKKEAELWLKSDDLNMPNGLSVVKNKLMVVGWGADINPETFATKTLGALLSIDLKMKTIEKVSKPFGNLDGLSQTLHGYFITDWLKGALFYYSNNTVTEVMDLPKGSADTYFDKSSKTLYIPLMLDNKLLKFHFEQ